MTAATEALGEQSQLQSALDAGLDQLSQHEEVVFTQYQKYVFNEDGYIFWVATATKMKITGSLHYSTDRLQDEDQTIGSNMVILKLEGSDYRV